MPTQKSAWKWRWDFSQHLVWKVTKGIHSCKPASLNRPIQNAESLLSIVEVSSPLPLAPFTYAPTCGAKRGISLFFLELRSVHPSPPPTPLQLRPCQCGQEGHLTHSLSLELRSSPSPWPPSLTPLPELPKGVCVSLSVLRVEVISIPLPPFTYPPARAAKRGVSPSLSLGLRSAPASTSAIVMRSRPRLAATCNAVNPWASVLACKPTATHTGQHDLNSNTHWSA